MGGLPEAPPGPPPGVPGFDVLGPAGPEGEPPGPPEGLPPGFPPGMPPFMGMPPPGFPPGMGPNAVAEPEGSGGAGDAGPAVTAQAPPGSPPCEAKPKKRKGVEGLASNKSIKNGGAVTVYSGYDAVKLTPKAEAQPAQPAQKQITGGGVAQGFQRQLPDGWEVRKSRSTGKTYYVNEKLGKSQFEPPAGSTIDKTADKKKKAPARSKDVPEAAKSDRGGMMGLMRANEQKKGRWAKWQKCNEILNEPDPEEPAGFQDDRPSWKGKGKGRGRRRDDDDD